MNILGEILNLLVVQAYWFSIIIIGYAIVLYYINRKNIELKTVTLWQSCPFPVKVLFSFAVGILPFIILTIVGYVFSLPAWVMGVYWLFLITAVIVLWVYRREVYKGLGVMTKRVRDSRKVLLAVAVLAVVLLFDFAFVVKFGNWAEGDALIHVAKVIQVAGDGFTLTDKTFGEPVVESRYHVNVIHTLYAVPVWMGMDQWTSWRYTLPFMRVMFFLAIYSLSWLFIRMGAKRISFKKEDTFLFASLATAAGAATLSRLMFTANYPNHIVYIWLIIFTFGLYRFFTSNDRANAYVLMLASLLLAMTHPTYAVIAATMLGLTCVIMTLFNKRLVTKQRVLSVISVWAVLLSTAVLTKLLPNQQGDFYESFSADRFDSVFGLSYLIPTFPDTWSGLLLLAIQMLGALFIFFKLARSKTEKLITLALIVFVALVQYFPPVFTLISVLIPKYLIILFMHMGVIWWVALPFGVLAVVYHLFKIPRVRELAPGKASKFLVFTVILGLIMVPTQTYGAYKELVSYSEEVTVPIRQDLETILPDDEEYIILSDLKTSHIIPSVSDSRIVMMIFSNSSPAADRTGRMECHEQLISKLDPADLKAADVSYVVASAIDPNYKEFKSLIERSEYLNLVRQSPTSQLYEFSGYSGTSAPGVCNFNE